MRGSVSMCICMYAWWCSGLCANGDVSVDVCVNDVAGYVAVCGVCCVRTCASAPMCIKIVETGYRIITKPR